MAALDILDEDWKRNFMQRLETIFSQRKEPRKAADVVADPSLQKLCEARNLQLPAVLQLVRQSNSAYICVVGSQFSARRPEETLVRLLEQLFNDAAYHRNMRLQRDDGVHKIDEVVNLSEIMQALLWHNVPPTDRHRMVCDAANSCPLLCADIIKGTIRRRALRDRLFVAVRQLLLRPDETLRESNPAGDAYELADILAHRKMAHICNNDVAQAAEVLAGYPTDFQVIGSRVRFIGSKAGLTPMQSMESYVRGRTVAPRLQWTHPPPAGSFTVLTYNLLVPQFANTVTYPHADPDALDWPLRLERIRSEIQSVGPSIVCLQELQRDESGAGTVDEVVHMMKGLGYKGDVAENASVGVRFCVGVFVRTDIFEFVNLDRIRLFDHLLKHRFVCTKSSKALQAPQAALVAHVLHKATSRPLVVASVHIASTQTGVTPKQMCQGKALLDYLAEQRKGAPVVLCGDFNTIPSNGLHTLITRGTFDISQDPGCRVEAEMLILPYLRFDRPQSMVMASAHTIEPEFTTKVETDTPFCECIDYIFYTTRDLAVHANLVMPTLGDLPDGLPTTNHPSDHLPIGAAFTFL